MRTDCISNTNLQGKVVIMNKFSNKPKQYKEEIVSTGVVNEININSKASKYIETAKKTISDYKAKKEQLWKKEHDKQEWKEIGEIFITMSYIPLIMIVGGAIEGAKEISKDFRNMFNKAKKFAIKKG